MRVLGIDPGTRACGWGLVDSTRNKATHLGHGVVRMEGDLADRLAHLHTALQEVMTEAAPEVVAVEGIFTHRNSRSALLLGHARGVALLCAAHRGLVVHEYAPAAVKRCVVGNGRAEKRQVQVMVGAILGIPMPRLSDAADALAIALCHARQAPIAERLAAQALMMKSKAGRRGAG